jgi:hypothetical protein
MPAQTPSTFRLIGAGVTSVGALAAVFGSGGSNAQTFANLDTDRATYLERQCGHIRDATESVGCRGQASIDFDNARAVAARKQAAEDRLAREAAEKRIAEHQKATAEHQKAAGAARTAAQCLSSISDALTVVPPRITAADVRAAKITPTPSDDPCVWAGRLQPRLGALTKQ